MDIAPMRALIPIGAPGALTAAAIRVIGGHNPYSTQEQGGVGDRPFVTHSLRAMPPEAASFALDGKIILDSSGILAPRAHEYRRGSKILNMAAGGFGLEISEEDETYWHSVFRMTRELDHLVDRQEVQDTEPIIDQLMRGEYVGIDEEVSRQFLSAISHATTRQYGLVKNAFLVLPKFATRKRLAGTCRQLADVCHEEATCFAEVLSLDPERFPVDQQSQVESFNEWLQRVGVIAHMLDAAVDMPQDYRMGNISVEPSLGARIMLGLTGLEHYSHVLRTTSPRLGMRLGVAALVCAGDRKS